MITHPKNKNINIRQNELSQENASSLQSGQDQREKSEKNSINTERGRLKTLNILTQELKRKIQKIKNDTINTQKTRWPDYPLWKATRLFDH